MSKRPNKNELYKKSYKKRKVELTQKRYVETSSTHMYIDAHTKCDLCSEQTDGFVLCYQQQQQPNYPPRNQHTYNCLKCSKKCNQCNRYVCGNKSCCMMDPQSRIICIQCRKDYCNVCGGNCNDNKKCMECYLKVCVNCAFNCPSLCGYHCKQCMHFCQD